MSRFTAITILAIVTFLTIGAAVALAEVVTPDGTGATTEEGTWTCPTGNMGDVEAMRERHESVHGEGSWGNMEEMHNQMQNGDFSGMKEHHESIHGEGSWENMPGPGASTEEMRQHHESIHGEGSWDDMPGNTGTGYGPMMGGSTGQSTGAGPMMGGNW